MLLMAYDPIQPTPTRYDGYPVEALQKKDIIFIQGGITLSRKWIPGNMSVLHIKIYLLQRENTKKLRNRLAYECYFRK